MQESIPYIGPVHTASRSFGFTEDPDEILVRTRHPAAHLELRRFSYSGWKRWLVIWI